MGAPAVAVSIMRIMPFWSGFKAVANTLPYDTAVMGDFSLPEQKLASIPIPTLVIGGEKGSSAPIVGHEAVAHGS